MTSKNPTKHSREPFSTLQFILGADEKFQSAPKHIEIQYRAVVNSQGKATKTVQIISVPSKTQRWPSVTETMRYEGQTQPRKEAGN